MTRRIAAVMFIFGLAATVVVAAPAQAGGGGCHEAAKIEAKTTRVSIEGVCFKPTVVHIAAGDTVTWINNDPMAHAVTGAAQSFGDYTSLEPGRTFSHAFKEAGTYPYFCYIHPGMTGAVVVDGAVALQPVASHQSRGSGRRWLIVAVALGMAGLGLGTGYVMGRSAP